MFLPRQLVTDTPKKELQLVGVTAMFIASKYEELFPPEISDFAYITDDTYKKKQILEMERQIVRVLDFHLGKPLPTHFLRRFSKAAKAADKNHLVAKYLIELASIDYGTAHYKPSEVRFALFCLGRWPLLDHLLCAFFLCLRCKHVLVQPVLKSSLRFFGAQPAVAKHFKHVA